MMTLATTGSGSFVLTVLCARSSHDAYAPSSRGRRSHTRLPRSLTYSTTVAQPMMRLAESGLMQNTSPRRAPRNRVPPGFAHQSVNPPVYWGSLPRNPIISSKCNVQGHWQVLIVPVGHRGTLVARISLVYRSKLAAESSGWDKARGGLFSAATAGSRPMERAAMRGKTATL